MREVLPLTLAAIVVMGTVSYVWHTSRLVWNAYLNARRRDALVVSRARHELVLLWPSHVALLFAVAVPVSIVILVQSSGAVNERALFIQAVDVITRYGIPFTLLLTPLAFILRYGLYVHRDNKAADEANKVKCEMVRRTSMLNMLCVFSFVTLAWGMINLLSPPLPLTAEPLPTNVLVR